MVDCPAVQSWPCQMTPKETTDGVTFRSRILNDRTLWHRDFRRAGFFGMVKLANHSNVGRRFELGGREAVLVCQNEADITQRCEWHIWHREAFYKEGVDLVELDVILLGAKHQSALGGLNPQV